MPGFHLRRRGKDAWLLIEWSVLGAQEEDTAAGGAGRTDGGADEDVDPLDAFMAGNELKVGTPSSSPGNSSKTPS